MPDEVQVVRRLFGAVERRDRDELLACYAEDVEITEAQVLPYGGTYRGHDGALAHALGFLAAWGPYQGPDEVKLDPQFWGDGAGTVCVLFRHRAVDPSRGVRLDAPEVSIYQVRDGRWPDRRCFMPTPPPWPSSSPTLRQRQKQGSADPPVAPVMAAATR